MKVISTSDKNPREFLKKERKKRGLTQREVADYIKINHVTYSKIENGKAKPRLSTAVALADFFGIDIKSLDK